eukprot:Opistho-2@66966
MGSLFRSEEMELVQLLIQLEAAYETVSELGEIGLVQFIDLNPDVTAFQRNFVHDVRRCDEMDRKTRYFYSLMDAYKVRAAEVPDEELLSHRPQTQDMSRLESTLEELEVELKEIQSNEEMLERNFTELTDLRQILRKTATFFAEADGHGAFSEAPATQSDELSLLHGVDLEAQHHGRTVRLGFVTGVINTEKITAFERVLWRATRGNAFLRHVDADDEVGIAVPTPAAPTKVKAPKRSVFIVFFQGQQLEAKTRKICEGFGATVYPCPETPAERRELVLQVATRLEDLQSVLAKTTEHRNRVLSNVATEINSWDIRIKKMKSIYHTMNMFRTDVTRKALVAEGWVPKSSMQSVQLALRRAMERSGSSMAPILHRLDTKLTPPTYHKTNKFTAGFQSIVDAFGIASYREVNPGPFTIITFPFIFAIMFGDFGHGIIMMLAALFLCVREKQLAKFKAGGEIFDTMFAGRYIILLMGIFSMYTGLIYNDMFSKSLDIFGSSWKIPASTEDEVLKYTVDGKGPYTFSGSAYPFGIDPHWSLADNRLTFLNSYKMKMAVIIGVTQMLFGVSLGLFNHRYFRRPINIFCEWIPQVLFLVCIFGYLCFMIIYKWANPGNAPSVLLALINMFLKSGEEIPTSDLLYASQHAVQGKLVALALICVPWMLLLKPAILWYLNRRRTLHGGAISASAPATVGEEDDDVLGGDSHAPHAVDEHDEDEFEFGEVMVHQAIHTIEYCLGCISNTASYLRLWALSLAHAELSDVLWTMIFRKGFQSTNPIILLAAFAFWAVLTIAVLLIMEGLSAFLHALRLHWVEFQGKFYDGNGRNFQPFSFESQFTGRGEEDE